MTRSNARRTVAAAVVACVLVLGPPAAGQLTPSAPQPSQSSAAPTELLGLAPAVPTVRGKYLDVVPSVVRAGTDPRRFTLALDVTPKPGMRVYAPGNRGYTAVELTVEPQPGVQVGETEYPKAETYLFAPLNERVRVFSRRFRLSRTVTVTGSSPSGLVVSGRIEYQACDDAVCYLPQRMTVTWTVSQ
ncbi:MAG: protein-disulfide reductase DsbD domain-containing protein [Vicinamibacterales bacterium]